MQNKKRTTNAVLCHIREDNLITRAFLKTINTISIVFDKDVHCVENAVNP